MPPRQVDEVEVFEQCAAAQNHDDAAQCQRRLGDVAQHRGGCAFDDDFALVP